MKASQIHRVLDDFSVSPSRALGQNFLIDENIARWIVSQLEIAPTDCVVEVGPGTGALTEHIAPLCRKLILVEFDARLADYQRKRWEGDPHVEVHQADGASWDPRPLFAEQPVKFMGNLPYSAGGAILSNFLTSPCACSRAVVMLQKEFIDRILATPGDESYGLLSLRIQRDWIPRALRTVPPEAFSPRPKIDSTVMLLTPRDERAFPPYDHRLMDELMRRCFSQRRKQMHKQLPASPPGRKYPPPSAYPPPPARRNWGWSSGFTSQEPTTPTLSRTSPSGTMKCSTLWTQKTTSLGRHPGRKCMTGDSCTAPFTSSSSIGTGTACCKNAPCSRIGIRASGIPPPPGTWTPEKATKPPPSGNWKRSWASGLRD